jgi:hypothetical protein
MSFHALSKTTYTMSVLTLQSNIMEGEYVMDTIYDTQTSKTPAYYVCRGFSLFVVLFLGF